VNYEPESADTKLRGGYYTPPDVASLLSNWALVSGEERVLEPSCGDGNFIEAALGRLHGRGFITGVELSPTEAGKALSRGGDRARIVFGDVFDWYSRRRASGVYDAVLGNPPFIRYQNFPEAHRQPAFDLMRSRGLNPSRLTNAWVPFVVLATDALKDGGRLGLVMPAELLQVGYAGELREYLARNYSDLTIVTFRTLIFKGIQQETILLMGVKKAGTTARIVFRELNDVTGLASLNGHHDTFTVNLDHAREKWTQYYLSADELRLIRELEQSTALTTLGALAEIDVGIVTGRNEFFVLTPTEAKDHGLSRWCRPLVGKSAQIPGLQLTLDEWNDLRVADSRCLLLNLPDVPREELDEAAIAFVRAGEQSGYHRGYKCRIRQPRWWKVPSPWVPDAFLLRQIYDAPRIVVNKAGAVSTDTIHRVRARPNIDAALLAACALNSATCAFSEIRGRSYGGGVLELEPREAEALPFPLPRPLDLQKLDSLLRRQGTAAALEEIDRTLLRTVGMDASDIATLRAIWHKLSSRRMRRNKGWRANVTTGQADDGNNGTAVEVSRSKRSSVPVGAFS